MQECGYRCDLGVSNSPISINIDLSEERMSFLVSCWWIDGCVVGEFCWRMVAGSLHTS